MPNYVISNEARDQIAEILENVTEYTGYRASAVSLLDAFLNKFELIAYLPDGMGRLRKDGTREAFERRYRIVYETQRDQVVILAVIHSSRIYPRPV